MMLRIRNFGVFVLFIFFGSCFAAISSTSIRDRINDVLFHQTNLDCKFFDGARIWSDEPKPKFLGEFATKGLPNSIFNSLGRYGGRWSKSSIWSKRNVYSNNTSDLSLNNLQAKHPPFILLRDKRKFILHSDHTLFDKAISPDYLQSCYSVVYFD